MGRFKRGTHPNSRNGFKKGNSKGKVKPEFQMEDDRRLWFWKFAYKRRAKRKGIEVNLSDQQFLSLVKSDCYYCGKSYLDETRVVNKNKVQMLTIDRLDSSMGYTLENCTPACKQCNTIKMDSSFQDFINKIKQITRHLKLVPES